MIGIAKKVSFFFFSCSVVCFKSHKEGKCTPKQPEPTVTLEIDTKGNISSQNVLFPTDDTVLPETLEKLSESFVKCVKKINFVLVFYNYTCSMCIIISMYFQTWDGKLEKFTK